VSYSTESQEDKNDGEDDNWSSTSKHGHMSSSEDESLPSDDSDWSSTSKHGHTSSSEDESLPNDDSGEDDDILEEDQGGCVCQVDCTFLLFRHSFCHLYAFHSVCACTNNKYCTQQNHKTKRTTEKTTAGATGTGHPGR
jgi:hypothetical protein